jgi:hypothetical protein
MGDLRDWAISIQRAPPRVQEVLVLAERRCRFVADGRSNRLGHEQVVEGEGWIPEIMRTQSLLVAMAVEHPIGEME